MTLTALCSVIRSVCSGAVPVLESSGATLAFHALTPDSDGVMQLQLLSEGSETLTRTSDQHVLDHENIYRKAEGGEAAWYGGRRVRNISHYSNDMTAMAIGISTGLITELATQLVVGTGYNVGYFPAGGSTPENLDYKEDDTFVFSAVVSSDDLTDTTMVITFRGDKNVTAIIPLTSTPTRFSVEGAASKDATSQGLRFGFSEATDTGGGTITITDWQIEKVSGQSNQNPGEIVSTTGAAASKWYSHALGNTVSSNIVTEATGAAFATVPSLQLDPGATNECVDSNNFDFATSAWGHYASIADRASTNTQDAVGLTGEANTGWTISDASASYTQGMQLNGSPCVTGEINVLRMFIRKDTDETRFPLIAFYPTNTAYWQLNTKTGAVTTVSGYSANHSSAAIQVAERGDTWEVVCECECASTGNGTIYFLPADGTIWGVGNVTAPTGSIKLLQVEWYQDTTIHKVIGTGPIFTTGSAASVVAPVLTFDSDNVNATLQAWYFELLEQAINNGNDYLNFDNSSNNIARYSTGADDFRATYAASNLDNAASGYAAGTLGKVGLVYDSAGDADVSLIVDAVTTTKTGFDTVTGDNLVVAKTVNGAVNIGDLRGYTIPDHDTGETTIDGLMA